MRYVYGNCCIQRIPDVHGVDAANLIEWVTLGKSGSQSGHVATVVLHVQDNGSDSGSARFSRRRRILIFGGCPKFTCARNDCRCWAGVGISCRSPLPSQVPVLRTPNTHELELRKATSRVETVSGSRPVVAHRCVASATKHELVYHNAFVQVAFLSVLVQRHVSKSLPIQVSPSIIHQVFNLSLVSIRDPCQFHTLAT